MSTIDRKKPDFEPLGKDRWNYNVKEGCFELSSRNELVVMVRQGALDPFDWVWNPEDGRWVEAVDAVPQKTWKHKPKTPIIASGLVGAMLGALALGIMCDWSWGTFRFPAMDFRAINEAALNLWGVGCLVCSCAIGFLLLLVSAYATKGETARRMFADAAGSAACGLFLGVPLASAFMVLQLERIEPEEFNSVSHFAVRVALFLFILLFVLLAVWFWNSSRRDEIERRERRRNARENEIEWKSMQVGFVQDSDGNCYHVLHPNPTSATVDLVPLFELEKYLFLHPDAVAADSKPDNPDFAKHAL